MINDEVSPSGMTDKQAQEFHKFFITGFIGFTAIAIGAHVLAWLWRPWIPGKNGYTSMLELTQDITQTFMS
ncbi:MAG: light-harvesting protein [Deltaproteobacteria bacterium]|nr:light-harvesting protein [Nannocystaceae bacterium]